MTGSIMNLKYGFLSYMIQRLGKIRQAQQSICARFAWVFVQHQHTGQDRKTTYESKAALAVNCHS